jgi:Fe-S-cluster containining protein
LGLTRTICDCPECALNCRVLPGYLIPDDVQPLFQAYNPDHLPFEHWAHEYLRASPGAIILTRDAGLRRVPTLVPAKNADGSCQFLDPNGRCVVHGVSPFGCAMFSAHQSQEEADRRSKEGIISIMKDVNADGPYANLWQNLWAAGHRAQPPEELRKRLTQLYHEIHRKGIAP